MNILDRELAELEKVAVPPTREPDFDAFWEKTLRRVRKAALRVAWKPVAYPIGSMEVRDLVFRGLDGTKVRAWYILPRHRGRKVPVVISYHGAGGSRANPAAHAPWTAMGYAVIAHDYRLQGGATGSESGFTAGNAKNGWFTLGLFEREGHYLFHSATDALRVVDVALGLPEIDPRRVAVHGGSQGGGTALTVAALRPEVGLCLADVPSNCWFEKRLFDEAGGVGEMVGYLKNHPDRIPLVLRNLSYFDNLNLAERITCPVLVSCGLRDPVCPPPNVYAAYNRIPAGRKRIVTYPFCKHEGGGWVHHDVKLAFIREYFG